MASVATAVGLVLLKVAAGVLTNSLSLLASAVDSMTDIFASAVNLVAIRAGSRPADREHRYGHGKAEGLAGLFQGVVIGASGLYLGYESVVRLIHPQPISKETVGVVVMVVSMVATYVLVRFLGRVAAETKSIAIAADSAHYKTDVLANLSVLIVLVVVSATGWTIVDPIFSLAVSVYILVSAVKVLIASADHLMDRALPDDVHQMVREIVAGYPIIRGIHDLKSRAAGSTQFIEMHLEIDGDLSLREAHDAAVEVLRDIERRIPNSKVFVHTDPVRVETPEGQETQRTLHAP